LYGLPASQVYNGKECKVKNAGIKFLELMGKETNIVLGEK